MLRFVTSTAAAAFALGTLKPVDAAASNFMVSQAAQAEEVIVLTDKALREESISEDQWAQLCEKLAAYHRFFGPRSRTALMMNLISAFRERVGEDASKCPNVVAALAMLKIYHNYETDEEFRQEVIDSSTPPFYADDEEQKQRIIAELEAEMLARKPQLVSIVNSAGPSCGLSVEDLGNDEKLTRVLIESIPKDQYPEFHFFIETAEAADVERECLAEDYQSEMAKNAYALYHLMDLPPLFDLDRQN